MALLDLLGALPGGPGGNRGPGGPGGPGGNPGPGGPGGNPGPGPDSSRSKSWSKSRGHKCARQGPHGRQEALTS